MIQLIINNITLPEAKGDRYRCYEQVLSQQVDMISGRRVEEVRGKVWRIEWSYDYLGNALTRQLLTALRGRTALNVAFLPDNGTELQAGSFLVDSVNQPTYAFSRYGVGLWHDLGFVLREVAPHD